MTIFFCGFSLRNPTSTAKILSMSICFIRKDFEVFLYRSCFAIYSHNFSLSNRILMAYILDPKDSQRTNFRIILYTQLNFIHLTLAPILLQYVYSVLCMLTSHTLATTYTIYTTAYRFVPVKLLIPVQSNIQFDNTVRCIKLSYSKILLLNHFSEDFLLICS